MKWIFPLKTFCKKYMIDPDSLVQNPAQIMAKISNWRKKINPMCCSVVSAEVLETFMHCC